MREQTHYGELIGQIESQKHVLEELSSRLNQLFVENVGSGDRSWKIGLAVAGVLDNYYTCAETILFRIVQDFGNSLESGRWHADLLARLIVDVENVRPRVIRDDTSERLDELRRFRHFKRYYYRTDYDWDKLEFLVKKQREVHPMLLRDLDAFAMYLRQL